MRSLARACSIDDIAGIARRRLPSAIAGYLDGGGESEYTLRHNRTAFEDWELLPATMTDVSDIKTATNLLGTASALPIALAPVGGPRLIHPDGELAVARAAAASSVPYGISTLSTEPLDVLTRETAAAMWLQIYVWGDRGVARDLVDMAKELGYRAVLLSVDVSVRSERPREIHAGLQLPQPHPSLRTVVDGALHPVWSYRFVTSPPPGFPNIGIPSVTQQTRSMESMFDGTVSLDDVEWIRDAWPGPLAVKGILSPRDARRARDHGADAVIVSNHGGRQADHVPATIDALPAVVDEVGGEMEVLMDSGIRHGSDVLTALALGAKGVLVGRAYLYGLAAAGEPGVRHAIDVLANELRIEMALCGVTDVTSIPPGLVRRRRDATKGEL